MANKLQTKILLVLSLTGLATTIGFGAFLINSKTIEASYGVNENLKPVAYIEGSNVQYSSIEKALEVANTLAQSGTVQNVYVIPGTNPTISRQCIVGSNVNLILPYEGTTYYNEATPDYNGGDSAAEKYEFFKDYYNTSPQGSGYATNYADNNPERFRKNSVTIQKCEQDGVTVPTIIVKTGGTINIGGFRGYLPQGSTNGNYCELVMEQDALIECDGTINCYGYIKLNRDDKTLYFRHAAAPFKTNVKITQIPNNIKGDFKCVVGHSHTVNLGESQMPQGKAYIIDTSPNKYLENNQQIVNYKTLGVVTFEKESGFDVEQMALPAKFHENPNQNSWFFVFINYICNLKLLDFNLYLK